MLVCVFVYSVYPEHQSKYINGRQSGKKDLKWVKRVKARWMRGELA